MTAGLAVGNASSGKCTAASQLTGRIAYGSPVERAPNSGRTSPVSSNSGS